MNFERRSNNGIPHNDQRATILEMNFERRNKNGIQHIDQRTTIFEMNDEGGGFTIGNRQLAIYKPHGSRLLTLRKQREHL